MSYRTILAVLSTRTDVGPVVAAAQRLGCGRDIHLIGCHGEPSQFVVMGGPIDVPDATTIAVLYEEADARMRVLGDAFSELCTREGLSYEWRPVHTQGGDSAQSSVSSARVADIVLVRQPDRSKEEVTTPDFEALMFESGRPVLFLPADGALADPVERVLIAWDGSREAARAVHDAMPLLKAAKSVDIVIVDADRQANLTMPLPGSDIAASLARHDIHAEISTVGREGRSTSDAIAGQVVATNADLLVMGAYTHQRISQWLFGGVTRAFLDKLSVATLMSR
ncbi:nucleotide-binding universal stress UspA family protein [Hoeflea marina]|uniref:Nucleotide-binding universal stress UspA family protein n=1 Tax=Hoeflea marina TaxID=274592 RepID=A0A317PUA1_9HYPH|nr:universal stress protein [Hoeflea marina]PWW04254.1 nucleotide-binding universal stress UspA family protein [Hoeflea marina]